MSKSDIFFFPSKKEPFGIVVTEALSYGLPVVASNTFAMPEIVGKAGFALNLNYEKKIKEKLVSLIKNSSLRNKLSKVAKNRAKNYKIESINIKLEKIYSKSLR